MLSIYIRIKQLWYELEGYGVLVRVVDMIFENLESYGLY